jgi:hypothetical protein
MATQDGPQYPGIEDGLVYAFDPKNRICWSGGDTITNIKDTSLTGTATNMGPGDYAAGALTTGGYFNFDGTDAHAITTMDGTSSSPFGSGAAKEYTVSFWFNADSLPAQQGLFQWANTTNDSSPMMFITSKNTTNEFYAGAYVALTGTISTGTWYNLTLSRTASDNTWRSYRNGIANSTYDDSGTISNETSGVSLYFMSGYNAYGDGNYGPFLLYNRALSSAEVLTNYNRLKGRFGL